MFQSNQALFQPLKSISSATFTGSYQALGTVLSAPARLIKIVNNSTVVVTISYDGGITDHDFIPIGSFTLYDFGTNRATSANALDLPKGTQVSIKGNAGTGSVYLVSVSAYTPSATIPGS